MEQTYTIKEVAKYLGVQDRTVWNYIKAGQLKASMPGRRWIVTESQLQDFLDKGTEQSYTNKLKGLTEDETSLLDSYRRMDPEEQKEFSAAIRMISNNYDYSPADRESIENFLATAAQIRELYEIREGT